MPGKTIEQMTLSTLVGPAAVPNLIHRWANAS